MSGLISGRPRISAVPPRL